MAGKIDWDYAHNAVGGSVELLLEVIDIFFEEYPKLIAEIEAAIESKALVELRRGGHTLKGGLRYFGETQAGELAYELEVMGRDDQLDRAKEVFAQLQTEIDAVVVELKAFVAAQPPGPQA